MYLKIFLTVFLSLGYAPHVYAAVSLVVTGLKASVRNGLVEMNFNADATIASIMIGGKNIASTRERSFYIDWNNRGEGIFRASSIHVVENRPSVCHFYWLQENVPNTFRIELHYIMVEGVSGIYSYAKYSNDKRYNLIVGETRSVYRFNPAILNEASNQVRVGKLYTYGYLNQQHKIQDETWQLPDHSFYAKYDFASYLRETNYQGVFGNGHGAFLISPSREYHAGGPLRQDLTVHQDALITNYFVSSHFGTEGLKAGPGWSHVYGPWLLYFNTGATGKEILYDVAKRVEIEKRSWPYKFVKEAEYPLFRGTITGRVLGQKYAMVVIWDETSQPVFEQQALGYLYNTKTNAADGSFSINNVRPGNYKVAAYPLAGHGSDSLSTKYVRVIAGQTANIGNLFLREPFHIIWAIGQTARKSDEFRLSNNPRSYLYHTLPPANLIFRVGASNIATDWYYAQTKPGTWTVQYHDTRDGFGRTLRVALAAGSTNPHLVISLNGHKVGDVFAGNDAAIYRSAMQSGNFGSSVFKINSVLVWTGLNTLTLHLSKGMVMYDTISLQKG